MLASPALLTVPDVAFAEVPGVKELVAQGLYWKSKGRQDLAEQALRRALALDPGNAQARQALHGGGSTPAPAPARTNPPAHPAGQALATKAAPKRAAEPARSARAERPAAKAPANSAARQRAADTAGKQRMAGFDALDDNNLDAAATRFQRALATNRNDGDALGGLGIVRLRQSRFAEARDLLEQASRQPNPARWAQALGTARFYAGMDEARALLARGQTAQAQSAAEALARSGFSQPAPAFELLADIYERQGRYADAADFYRQASELGGSQSDQRLQSRAARGRAMAAAARGDDVTAEQEFQGGLTLDPNDPWIRYEFARFLIRHGRSVEAESLIASLSRSSDPDGLYAAALINADLNRNAAAESLIDRIPDSQRTPAMRNFVLGVKTDAAIERAKAMAAAGQRTQAVSALRQLGGLKTLPAARRAAIASALYDLGDGAGASQFAQAAMSGDIADLEGYDAVVRVLAKTGRDDLARAALQRASSLGNTSPEGQRTLARMAAGLSVNQADRLRLAGQFAQAFDVLRAAWNAAPDNLEVISALARLYQSGGMSARAAQTYQIVLTRDGRNRDALLGLAQTAQAAGDRALSESAQQQALAAFPQDYQVRMTLAQVAQSRGDRSGAVRLLKEARALYSRQSGSNGIDAFGGNPFSGDPTGMGTGNPFRDRAVAQPQPVLNPFSLGNGTRLPTANAPVAQPQAMSSGYGAPGSYGAPAYGSPGYGTPAYGAPAYGTQAYAAPTYGAAPSPYGAANTGNTQYGNTQQYGNTPYGAAPGAAAPASRQASRPQPMAYATGNAPDTGFADAGGFAPAAAPRAALANAPVPAFGREPAASFTRTAYDTPAQPQDGYAPGGYTQADYPQNVPQQNAYPQAPYPQTAYPQNTYPQAAYPQGAYPQGAYPQGAYPQGTYAQNAQPYAAPYPAQQPYEGQPFAPSPFDANGGGSQMAEGPLDPVMASIENDIAKLTAQSGPRVDLSTSYRERQGETGLSQLRDMRGTAEISTGLFGGRVHARAEAVVIDAGRPTGSALARFGTNATPEAQGIVNKQVSLLKQAETQHKSGVAVSAGYDDQTLHVDVGSTPINMGRTTVSFHAGVTPSLGGGVQAQAWVERRPVTDSIISFAGTRDPVSGLTWGQVMRLGGGGGLSIDRNGSGAYGSVAYNTYRGTRVAHNSGIEANVGGYLRVMQTEHSHLSTGINVNYQAYDNPQNYFTYGHGGYFSPQSFLSVSFPVRYELDKGKLTVKAAATPGYQSYNQDEVALYPIDANRQSTLDGLKAINSDVRARYDSLSKTGFALSAEGSLYYQVSPSTRIGGEASYNTFGSYDEIRSTIGIRQSLGASK
ncbi:cellulose synthase subunit BcsC-related outer membrane protein [Novosphingobium pituita]|uniref:cellulose synthase subunit BcsC-related outer membrane protein n=1 Tax=Novosphingobium pituita TaxID=3056842 RepID=UPI00295EEEDF|nr:cellulose synthase subunit BcsC-related outer membrane protein [Novosphingobium sp. IK01]